MARVSGASAEFPQDRGGEDNGGRQSKALNNAPAGARRAIRNRRRRYAAMKAPARVRNHA